MATAKATYALGRAAYKARCSRNTNPHRKYSSLYLGWDAGWKSGVADSITDKQELEAIRFHKCPMPGCVGSLEGGYNANKRDTFVECEWCHWKPSWQRG